MSVQWLAGRRSSATSSRPEAFRKKGLFYERVGPLYSVDSVARLLNRTDEDVQADIRDRILLAIQLADGVIALPARQFDEAGLPLPGLRELSTTLDPKGTHPLSVALILFTKSDYWGGATTAQVMRAGRLDDVVSAAERIHRSLTGP